MAKGTHASLRPRSVKKATDLISHYFQEAVCVHVCDSIHTCHPQATGRACARPVWKKEKKRKKKNRACDTFKVTGELAHSRDAGCRPGEPGPRAGEGLRSFPRPAHPPLASLPLFSSLLGVCGAHFSFFGEATHNFTNYILQNAL